MKTIVLTDEQYGILLIVLKYGRDVFKEIVVDEVTLNTIELLIDVIEA